MGAATKAQSKTEGLWIAGVALTAAGFGLMVQGLLDLSFMTVGIAVTLIIGAAGFVAPKQPNPGKARFLPPLIMIPLLLFCFWYFMTISFGHFGIGPILFHMDYGVEANGLVVEFMKNSIVELSVIVAVTVGLWLISITDYRFARLDRVAVLPLLIFNPFSMAVMEYVGDAEAASEQLLEARFVDTTGLERPDGEPLNLIHIILESSERTLYDETAFGDVMAPFDRFVGRGLELTNVHQAALTSWSLAGDVANNCGVPLLPLGFLHENNFHLMEGGFLPNANCLGDLLARDGYSTSVMHTSPLQFAGADKFYGSHSWEALLGMAELRPHYPRGGNEWGLDDEDLYDAVYNRAVEKAEAGEPFAITMANIGGHSPHGFVSRSCHGRPTVDRFSDPTLKAYRCTHELAAEMLDRLDAGGYLDNTIVIVQSDHLAMRNTIYRALQQRERRNLFFAFGPGIEPQVIDRDMTMMDIYPTILDMMGYAPVDGRAGIGVSAFSPGANLIEERGLKGLDKAIYADSALRDRLWGIEPGV